MMADSERENNNNSFYIKENIKDRLIDEEVEIDDLSLSELLASERTSLANKRNVLALKRNLQAAERTYSAWVRTGFSIVSAGVAFAGWLRETDAVMFSNIVGSLLILVGVMSFMYAWYGYYDTYKWLNLMATTEQEEGIPETGELTVITIITIMLLIISVSAFVVIIFT